MPTVHDAFCFSNLCRRATSSACGIVSAIAPYRRTAVTPTYRTIHAGPGPSMPTFDPSRSRTGAAPTNQGQGRGSRVRVLPNHMNQLVNPLSRPLSKCTICCMDPATTKHQLALPYVLAFAPGLAATHAVRARKRHPASPDDPPILPAHCPRCGSSLISGASQLRIRRDPSHTHAQAGGHKPSGASAPAAHPRYVQQCCGACGHVKKTRLESIATLSRSDTVPAALAESPLLQSLRSDAAPAPAREPSLDHRPERRIGPSSDSPPAIAASSVSSAKAVSKSRPKKRSGLQDLLARNREKQEQEKQGKSPGGGLAAFLSGL